MKYVLHCDKTVSETPNRSECRPTRSKRHPASTGWRLTFYCDRLLENLSSEIDAQRRTLTTKRQLRSVDCNKHAKRVVRCLMGTSLRQRTTEWWCAIYRLEIPRYLRLRFACWPTYGVFWNVQWCKQDQGLLRRGKEANCLHMEVGGFSFTWGRGILLRLY